MYLRIQVFLWLSAPLVRSLQPYKFYEEGPCSRIRYEPLPNLNRRFLDSLKYVQSGSRYHIYVQASPYSQYDYLNEGDLVDEFCFERNLTTTDPGPSVGSVTGFGRRAVYTFRVSRPENNKFDLYFEATPRDGLPSWDVARHYITLTDNQNFAVEVTCWTGSNQIGWMLLTKAPFIDPELRRIAMDHAVRMGFDSRNFIDLHHDLCGAEHQQRNLMRFQAGDVNNYRSRPDPNPRVSVPYQPSYLNTGLQSSPGYWPSRPGNINHNNYFGSWQQMRYRQQYRY